jgi:hypothetical protein
MKRLMGDSKLASKIGDGAPYATADWLRMHD